MKELTAFDISNLVKEASFLVGGKVDNVYQTEQKDLYLQIYVRDKPKQLLRILAGKCFYLVSKRPEFPENPQRLCTFLRKHIGDSKIVSLEQVGYERIIKIVLDAKGTVCEIFAEFFGKGNLIVAKEGKILAVSEEQVWADRLLKAGELYIYPQKQDTKEMFEKQKQKGTAITMKEIEEEFSKGQVAVKTKVKNKELGKIEVTISKQEKHLTEIEKESELNKKKGDLIYVNYEELKELFEEASKIKGKSEEELKIKLKKYKIFKGTKDGSLVVDL
ncbi:NFACT family protein [Candidatus Woesearchaeota archaeon]|nr:NFACT family protein [Candidatus Woesearchaeota archaeon]